MGAAVKTRFGASAAVQIAKVMSLPRQDPVPPIALLLFPFGESDARSDGITQLTEVALRLREPALLENLLAFCRKERLLDLAHEVQSVRSIWGDLNRAVWTGEREVERCVQTLVTRHREHAVLLLGGLLREGAKKGRPLSFPLMPAIVGGICHALGVKEGFEMVKRWVDEISIDMKWESDEGDEVSEKEAVSVKSDWYSWIDLTEDPFTKWAYAEAADKACVLLCRHLDLTVCVSETPPHSKCRRCVVNFHNELKPILLNFLRVRLFPSEERRSRWNTVDVDRSLVDFENTEEEAARADPPPGPHMDSALEKVRFEFRFLLVSRGDSDVFSATDLLCHPRGEICISPSVH
uniref:Uncharacterized protein n=1 Tax=Chromera velia CCMP2878 TaxID=1169474 RepID=A0A0G4H4X8_9ALVE|eukprot:Cvel_24691.t1-p1 / transcript=Cvel_24691.t1 / gene=Cvel_24691 / organism=Chromera_velia_CCMP2878 / gene_product=hypothetical protein / transcript_product=hypothetical protein / location=Cvel_scaffold2706:8684-9730(-) / protein_length=349 / sequence_SO=supercontig / SO=protein_coding / is_pseudo=false